MADAQADIARVCRLLDSDKATERKQNSLKLKDLLTEPEIQRLLDRNSDSGKKNVVSWEYVFKSVQAYCSREIELLIRQKSRNSQNVSSTVANNKEKKRKEVTALLKFVLKTADKRERCRLNGKDVVQHIITILKNEDMNGMFGADYQSILLKYILSCKTCRCEITCKLWHDLIDIFSKMITRCVGERCFPTKILFYLLMAASNQVDIKSSQIFKFYSQAFANIRDENNLQVLEYLLGSLTSFSNAVAIDCRSQLCQLGEDLIPHLLQIWNKPHPNIKEHLVQFIRLQVRLHHPSGVHLENDGARSCDATHWKKCLQKIYEAISGEIQQISGRIRGQSIKLESGLKQPLIELAADICHQLFWFHCNSSAMPLDSSAFDGPSSSKRRRLEVGWNVLIRDMLSNGQETPALLAWLKITTKLLEKFPSSLSRGEYVQLLTSLHHLQMEGKRQEIIAAVMICLKSVTLCHVHQHKESVEEISYVDLEEAGFELLESIVKKKLIDPDVEPWKLLSETGCNSSHRSLQFLWTYLNTLPLPEHFYYSTRVMSIPPSQLYPLRHQLLDWLLPPAKSVEQQSCQVDSYYSKMLSRLPTELLSRVLVTLTQRIFSKSSSCLESLNEMKDRENDLENMESIYILSSFDKNVAELDDLVALSNNKFVSFDNNTNNTVDVLLNYLKQRLLEISQKLLEVSSGELNISVSLPATTLPSPEKRLDVLTRYCSLCTKVMGFLLHFNAFSFMELSDSALYKTTMKILKTIANGMFELVRQRKEVGTLILGQSFIAGLNDLFLCQDFLSWKPYWYLLQMLQSDWLTCSYLFVDRYQVANNGKRDENTCTKTVMYVVRSVIPKELCNLLLDIVLNEPQQLNKSRIVPDEFDGSFDDSEVMMDDFEADDRVQNPAISDQDNLSEHDRLRLNCMEILCTLCSRTSASQSFDEFLTETQNRVFGYFKSENFNIVKPRHSKLFFTASFIFGSGLIKARHLLIVLQQLRLSVSKFRKDQEYCLEGLRLMTVLARKLNGIGTEEQEEIKEAQELALHLLRAFWNLRETNYKSSVRLQLAKCMDAFIRLDPDKSWAFFEMKINSNNCLVHISHVFPSLFCDPSHEVRMYMAEAIAILFLKFNPTNDVGVPENPVIQDELFHLVADALTKSLVVEKELTDNENKDEGVNRASSLLLAFKTIITVSCWCEPKVICVLFQATKERQLPQGMVAKVLEQISAIMDYESTHDFIKVHIGRIIDSWLDHGFKLSDFPYQTLAFTSLAQFLRTHHGSIMPHLIWRFRDKESLKTIGREIGEDGDWTKFLMLDFCQIMSIIVPCFAEQSRQATSSCGKVASSDELEAVKQNASACHEFLENILQKEVTDRLMVNKFDELVVELLLRMHDAPSELSGGSQFLRDYDPPTDKPYFTSHAIKATLDYLTKCHGGSNTLVSILCKRKENIQKILLRLTENLEETHVHHKRRSYLSMYRVFVLLLMQELTSSLAGTWAFVIRDIIYTLIRLMASSSSKCNATKRFTIQGTARDGCLNIDVDMDLFTASCDLLFFVCKVALSCCPQEIGNHLLAIVNEIIPFVSNKDNRAKKAFALLKFLVVENKSSLKSFISLLDPFPDQPEFAIFNEAYWSVRQNKDETTLSAEIEHYLLIGHSSRIEGLRYLRSRFSYYKEVNGSSLLMKMLRRLIRLCRNTSNSEVKVEVGKLIAEVGLPVFYVSSFNRTASAEEEHRSYTKACEVFRGDEEKSRNCRILHLLNDCLIDRNVKKVAAAASCLKEVFRRPPIMILMKAYEEHKIDHLFGYLEPFKPTRRTKKSERNGHQETTKSPSLQEVLKDSSIWNPASFNTHDKWISSLTSSLILSDALKDDVLECIAPHCQVDASFADHIFPYLIHDILLSYGDEYRELLSEQIRKIFSEHIITSSNQSRASTPLIPTANSNTASHNSIHSLLNVINYLRKQPYPKSGNFTTSWESNFWLDLNFLELAEAALKSSAYCTAILYVEIWRDIQRTTSSSSMEEQALDSQAAMEINSESTEENQEANYQTILFEAYASIGEPDAVYGSGSGLSTDLKARIHTYEQEKCWGKALRAYDLRCRQSGNQPCVGTIQALKAFGLEHVTYNYLQGLGDENQEEFLELQYESAWRNRIWNFDKDISKLSVDNKGFNQCVYDNIQSLKNKDLKLFHSSTNECRRNIMEELCQTNTESLWEVYPHISRLQCLGELEQAKKIFEGGDHEMILNNWIMNMPDNFNELELLEPILSLRTILLQELLDLSINAGESLEMKHSLLQGLVKHCEMVSRLARHAGRYQISEKAIATIKELQQKGETTLTTAYSWKIEEAKVFWFQKEEETAMRLLRQINQTVKHEQTMSTSLYAQTLGLYGSWLAETRSENPNTIMERYLDKAVELVEFSSDKQESSIEAFLCLARFSDSQYKITQDYMKSWAFENKQSIMNKQKSEIANLKGHGVDTGRYLRELILQSETDEQELVQKKEDRLKYLQKAVRNYIKCLQVGEKHDLKIFRICSLWMENSNDDSINRIVKDGIFSKGEKFLIQSRKFLPLMYQLAARLGARTHQNELFQKTLTKLISQAAIDHPHHVVWIILALCNADKDNKYINGGGGKGSSRLSKASKNNKEQNSYIDEDRVKAALIIIENVQKSKPIIVTSMKKLSEAYIELAYYDVSQLKNKTGPLPLPDVALKKIPNLRNVALPTTDIKVDASCQYKDILSIEKFESKYQLCGGINLPKILVCVGSDGIKRRQLVKGKDDLRQDAVMQQVFGMVNTLLQNNVETRKRNLKIRTYKVVPLSQRSGLVEWCEETTPLGNYLIGHGKVQGAHQKYFPKDWSPIECRKHMQTISRADVHQRFKVYKEVTNHFHPVFRHFFLEQFLDPSIWFERRLDYTRSVATASIVGYIVGLGDRHVQNILIDCNTAELIHIDLGVAFEQGKMLPTPETVPFRLTRDLVDGMGLSGVEGVFRRCCEKTMAVMRTSQEALLTIVEVLLYDPLYVWTLSPIQAMTLQRKADMDTSEVAPSNTDVLDTGNFDETSVNKMAERVLVRLRQKLDGIEDGTSLSVKGQVNHLIRQARDPKNLCRLFPGWQAWI